MKGKLYIVSAPSGAGKTSLCKALTQIVPNLKYSVSYTTRPRRPNETDGDDYFFITEDQFKEMAESNCFIEWAQVYSYKYGTSRKLIEESQTRGVDLVLDIDIQGAKKLRRSYPKGHFIFILPPSLEVLEERLIKRGTEDPDLVRIRLKKARQEIPYWKEYDFVIINDNFQSAIKRLESIILAQRCRTRDMERTVSNLYKTGD